MGPGLCLSGVGRIDSDRTLQRVRSNGGTGEGVRTQRRFACRHHLSDITLESELQDVKTDLEISATQRNAELRMPWSGYPASTHEGEKQVDRRHNLRMTVIAGAYLETISTDMWSHIRIICIFMYSEQSAKMWQNMGEGPRLHFRCEIHYMVVHTTNMEARFLFDTAYKWHLLSRVILIQQRMDYLYQPFYGIKTALSV